jgi:hypothetical protein
LIGSEAKAACCDTIGMLLVFSLLADLLGEVLTYYRALS